MGRLDIVNQSREMRVSSTAPLPKGDVIPVSASEIRRALLRSFWKKCD